MNLRIIKHLLLRLSIEEKMLGVGAIIVLASAFLPWYSVVFSFNENGITESGFSGDLGVIGFVVFLLSAMALGLLAASHLRVKLPQFGYNKEQILLFLMGQSAFLVLLTIAIYTKRSLEYTNAELRFGLYLSLIGACIGAFAGFAQIQKNEKKDAKSFFEHPEESNATIKEPNNTAESSNDAVETPLKASGEMIEEIIEEPIKEIAIEKSIQKEPQQESFFPEELAEDEMAEPEDTAETSPQAENAVETQDLASTKGADEQPTDQPTEETNVEQVGAKEPEPISTPNADSQEEFTMRDAGLEPQSKIKVDVESIRPVEKEVIEEPTLPVSIATKGSKAEKEKKEAPSSSGSGFYDDL